MQRYDLIGERRPSGFARRKRRRPGKELSFGRALKGFVILLAINAAIALFFFGLDPEAFTTPTGALETVGVRSNMCHKLFLLIPETWQSGTVCLLANVSPFLIMPTVVLVWLIGRGPPSRA